MPDAQHTITITIKGSSAGGTGGTQVEFGGFMFVPMLPDDYDTD